MLFTGILNKPSESGALMKSYLEISISANETQRELLIPHLIELGCGGFEESESFIKGYIDKSNFNQNQLDSVKTKIKNILQTVSVNSSLSFREIFEENWNEKWERTIRPIEIGNKLVVKPSWCRYDGKTRIIIQIDPKMSFGTGYHETTRLTLRLLEKYLQTDSYVLDAGTGTGILAIAAVKLGARSVIAVDTDEWSIANARENVSANGVSDKITVSSAPVHEIPESGFDLITANLTLQLNIELLNEFKSRLKTDGFLLLSGFILSDQERMTKELNANNFKIIENIFENEWIAIASGKSR